VTKKM